MTEHGERLDIDGAALELVRLPGARPGPTIVFLHEGLGSVALWKDVPARVVELTGLSAVVYSRRGHGHSDPDQLPRAPTFMHHEGEVVLPALLDALALDEVILLGHSDGASIALLAAARPDRRIRRLVLLAPHVFVEDLSVTSIVAAQHAFAHGDLRERLAKYHADPNHTFRAWNDIWLDPAFRDWDIRDRLARIACPILIIQGRDDEYGTLAQVDAIAAATHADVLILDECGHSPHRGRRELVLAAAAAFMMDDDRTAGR
jgi:pimeloyl-ACP methyl ester carboxylesterase